MNIEQIYQAREKLKPYLKATPLAYSAELSRKRGRDVFLKLESLQPTGSFKVRPALNNIVSQLDEAKKKGVIASSSGNFAQAVAYGAKLFSCDARIVMPQATSAYKVERTRQWGAEVVECGNSFQERWQTTFRIQKETGRLLVHPYDSDLTMAGDGTLALELLDQLAEDFTVLVPVSGGGLIAGIAVALKTLRPKCRIVGVQPGVAGAMAKSISAGRRIDVGSFTTLADALVAAIPGEKTFQVSKDFVDEFVLVSENEIREAVRFLALEQKLIAEPGAAVGVAALLSGKLTQQAQPVICVISGGNVSTQTLIELLSDLNSGAAHVRRLP
ncbi:MAG: threonine/serine dehydratase [Bdellovibrionota bacterium]